MARTIQYEIDVNAQQSIQTVGSLEDMLSKLNDEIRDVDTTSDSFRTLSKEIQGVNSMLEKTNLEIEGFTSQKRRQAFQGSIDIFTGGIEAFAGIATQLGLSNDEFEETITNLVAVGATANGLRTATAGLFDLREALRSSAVAQRALNLLANANPYVLLATAVLALGAAYLIFRDDTDEARIAQEDLDEAIATTKTTVDGSIDSLINLAEAQKIVAQADLLEYEAIIDKLSTDEATREYAKTRAAERQAEIDGLDATISSLRTERTVRSESSKAEEEERRIRQERIEDLKDEIALYGEDGDEGGLIQIKRDLLVEELALATTLKEQRDLKRQIAVLDKEAAELTQDRTRYAKSVNEIETRGIEIMEQGIETKEVDIKVTEAVTDNQVGSVDEQLGALNDFATQAAVLAEQSKGLAIAAVITNAAVAGIAAWRSWTEDGPFGQPGNTIAAVAQIAVIGLGAVQAIKSINEAGNGAAAASSLSGSPSGPTVATPRNPVAAMPPGMANNQMLAQIPINTMDLQPTVLLTPTSGPGSLESSTRANNKRNNRRRL